MAGLCLLRHLSDNMKYAKKKVFGEEPEPFGGDFQHLIESVFEEARCEHANAGNIDRRQECNSCFNHVRNKVKFKGLFDCFFLFLLQKSNFFVIQLSSSINFLHQ